MSPSLSSKVPSRGSCWADARNNQSSADRTSRDTKERSDKSAAPAGMIDCFGESDIGKVRQRNEDQFRIADLTEAVPILGSMSSPMDGTRAMLNANLLLVADGVGGHAGGALASRLATDAVVEYLHSHQTWMFGFPDNREAQIYDDLKLALAWAQQRLQSAGEKSARFLRMGTTLTLAYLDWPTAYIAHVGDSRAYLYGRQELFQITHDQTVAQMLADAGAIEPHEVEHHPFRNMLGSLLCCEANQLTPCVYQRRLMPGDQLLLCTDGLTKHVPARRIAQILDSSYSAADACHELVAAANAAGGTDNITVVVACFGRRLAETTEDGAIGRDATTVFWLNRTMFS